MELKGKMDRFIIKVEDTNKFYWIPGNNKETKPKLLIFYRRLEELKNTCKLLCV